MTVRLLEVFMCVAKHLSILRAAPELHVTPSSVSHDLKRLEKHLGYELTTRTRRGIELTEAGVSFLPKAKALVAGFAALQTQYAPNGSKQPEESLSIGASHGMSTSLMPFLMAQFKETHPTVNLKLTTDTNREIEKLLLKGDLDFGIATNAKRFAALHMEPFRSATLYAFVPAKHSLAKATEITLRKLAGMPLVIRSGKESGSRTALLLKKMRDGGFKPNIAFACGSPDAVKTAVRNGTGVGLLVHDSVQDQVSRGEFATLKIKGIDLTSRTYILWPKKKTHSKNEQDFLALLRAYRLKRQRAERSAPTIRAQSILHDSSPASG
jgi:DNA-binding transcriptional LysR family regulator